MTAASRFIQLALLSAAVCHAQPIIVTAAGTDLVFSGDRKMASGVSLGRVSRITVDPNGRPVFADPNYHLVFRLENDGTIRVIAGNNIQGMNTAQQQFSFTGGGHSGGGYSGDNGPAIAAALNRPQGVAYDKLGNLYIADDFNNRIRIVNPQGTIDTFAGDGVPRFKEGVALSASFNAPTDVIVDDSGNVYVNDDQNHLIRRITPQGTVSTVCGQAGVSGMSGENVPCAGAPIGSVEAMALDAQGNLYFAENQLQRVRKVVKGVVTTLLGAPLVYPSGLAFDAAGNLLISDANLHIVRKLAGGVTGGALTLVAGISGHSGFGGDGKAATSANLYNPFGVAVSPSGILIADRDNFRIRQVDAQNNISTLAGDGRLLSAQNGVAAPLATFFDPFGVSFNLQGNMFIADMSNNIVRRMNSNGTLITIAGNGAQEFGDTGAATQVGLVPFSVTSDASGNLYESEFSDGVVRKIGLDSQIATVTCGATKFQLQNPTQSVFDSRGVLYIADWGTSRISRCENGALTLLPGTFASPGGLAVDPAGASLYVTEWAGARVVRVSLSTFAVTTIAGGGALAGFAADGRPATSAKLGHPAGIALDSQLNVYFSDHSDAAVRRISASDGTISTIAGNYLSGFSGDGGPATAASLRDPWGLAFDSAGSLYIADSANNRIRKLLISNPPAFTVDQLAISFTAPSSGTPPDTVPIALGGMTGLLYSVSADQPWLQVKPAFGSMPASVQIAADPTGLGAGTYSGTVTVNVPGASPAARTVKVTFTVAAQLPPSLSTDLTDLPICLVDPRQCPTLGLSFLTGADPVTRQIAVQNQGGGTLNFSASVSLDSGTDWLAVTPASGSASPTAPGIVTVNVTPGNLPEGTYSGSIRIASPATNQTVSIPIAISITAPATKPVLSQTGLTFSAMPGGGKPLARTFTIGNEGQGSLNWTAKATTLSGGSWLGVSPGSGTVATPLTDFSPVTVSVDPSQVPAAGLYFGQIEVNTPGNRVQTVTVQLNVGPTAPLDIYPSGLLFQNQPGAKNPGSQTIAIANVTGQPLTFSTTRLADTAQPWFVAVPSNGTIEPNQQAAIVVQPDFTNLQSGVAHGTLRLALADLTSFNVELTAVAASGTAASATAKDGVRLAPCSPNPLNLQLISTPNPFVVTLPHNLDLQVKVLDNCGSPLTSGDIHVFFTNGDVPTTMKHQGGGIWSCTWQPTIPKAQMVAELIAVGFLVGGKLDLNGTVLPAVNPVPLPPVPRAVLNSASGAPLYVAPGGFVSIYGELLADPPNDCPIPPPATEVNGTQVLLGGLPLLLNYACGGQVNAQIPFDADPNQRLQLTVRRGVALSNPSEISVAPAQPGIYTQDGSGSGPGRIFDATNNNAQVTADTPAHPGDSITIQCNGLGLVDPPVVPGQPPPDGSVSTTINPVTVTIGGQSMVADSAGLAPGSTDLYLVKLTLPADVTTGDAVPVTITVAKQTSQIVTMAIQP